jgi:arylsulfatase A-like enzyme
MGPTCNLPIRSGKGWNYEGGTRIPTFFYWKGHIAPATSDLPIISMDMYPTLLELAGLPLRPKQHIDGQSLASVIMGKPPVATLKNRTLFWNYPHGHGSGHRPSAAIQKNGWKLIHWNSNRGTELYHISQDPSEKQEVSKKYPEKTKELLDDLKALIKETNKK